jgi:hypothetical protein
MSNFKLVGEPWTGEHDEMPDSIYFREVAIAYGRGINDSRDARKSQAEQASGERNRAEYLAAMVETLTSVAQKNPNQIRSFYADVTRDLNPHRELLDGSVQNVMIDAINRMDEPLDRLAFAEALEGTEYELPFDRVDTRSVTGQFI